MRTESGGAATGRVLANGVVDVAEQLERVSLAARVDEGEEQIERERRVSRRHGVDARLGRSQDGPHVAVRHVTARAPALDDVAPSESSGKQSRTREARAPW